MSDTSNFSCQFFTPDGTKMYFTIPVRENIFTESIAFSAAALLAGLTHEPPGIDDGNAVTIVTVMRREKGDGTPIIDFYPDWGFPVAGKETFGTFRNLGIYMNTDQPQLTADFLAFSGFKSLDQIPLYDGQAPLKRNQDRPHAKETKVPTPFRIVREQGEEKIGSDGKPYRPWILVRYEALNGNAPAPTGNVIHDEPAQPSKPVVLSAIDDRDFKWVTVPQSVADFCKAVITYLAEYRVRMSAADVLDTINGITKQSAKKFSELDRITHADGWAACLLRMTDNDKAKALALAKDDAGLAKAINFWASATTADIDFMS